MKKKVYMCNSSNKMKCNTIKSLDSVFIDGFKNDRATFDWFMGKYKGVAKQWMAQAL